MKMGAKKAHRRDRLEGQGLGEAAVRVGGPERRRDDQRRDQPEGDEAGRQQKRPRAVSRELHGGRREEPQQPDRGEVHGDAIGELARLERPRRGEEDQEQLRGPSEGGERGRDGDAHHDRGPGVAGAPKEEQRAGAGHRHGGDPRGGHPGGRGDPGVPRGAPGVDRDRHVRGRWSRVAQGWLTTATTIRRAGSASGSLATWRISSSESPAGRSRSVDSEDSARTSDSGHSAGGATTTM